MLTTSPHLHVRRPSPTTAEFTVTTRPPSTLALRLALAAVGVARLVVGAATLVLLHAKWILVSTDGVSPPDYLYPPPSSPTAPPPSFFSDEFIWFFLSRVVHASTAGRLLSRLASALPLYALLPGASLALYLVLARIHATESLLVLRGLGIQTSASSNTWLAGPATRFIPTEKVRDVLINEAFRGLEARHYLVVVVEGEEDMVVVFPRLLPSKRIVETVWKGVRGCLYERDGPAKVDEKG